MTVSFLQDFGVQSPPLSSSAPAMSVSVGNVRNLRARRNDPQTSHQAADRAERFAKSHAGRILFALQRAALTASEIGHVTGLSVVQVDRRLPELQRAGRAYVLQQGGQDVTRDGYRVWSAA